MNYSRRQWLLLTVLAMSLCWGGRRAGGAGIAPGSTEDDVYLALGAPRVRMVLQDGTHLTFANGARVVVRNGKVVSVSGLEGPQPDAPQPGSSIALAATAGDGRSFQASGLFAKTNSEGKGFSFSPKSAFACWVPKRSEIQLYFLGHELSQPEEQRLLNCCTNRALVLEQTLNSLGCTNARNNWHVLLNLDHSGTNITQRDLYRASLYIYGGSTCPMQQTDVASLCIDKTALGGTVVCELKYAERSPRNHGRFELLLANVTLRARIVECWDTGERNLNILRLEDTLREAGFKEKQ